MKETSMTITKKMVLLVASVTMIASTHAAVVSFSGPVSATNTSALDTEWLAGGTFVSGSTFGSGAKSFTTAGGQSISLDDGAGKYSNAEEQWLPNGTADTDVLEWTDALKGNLWYKPSDDTNPLTLHLTGLTINQKYAVQLYSADVRFTDRTQSYWGGFVGGTFTNGASASFSQNPACMVTGTFVADATTQDICIQETDGIGNDDTTLSAYVLYAVQEPVTQGFVCIIGIGMLFIRRAGNGEE